MDETMLLKNRLTELAKKAYNNNIYTFTDFLSIADISVYHEHARDLSFIPSSMFGGYDEAERVIMRFGNEELFGYSCPYPIKCLKVSPLMQKYADDLTHRDYLGALMNLGIDREVIGDIVVTKDCAYVFCLDHMADYIINNITRVKHTSVIITETSDTINAFENDAIEKIIQISSERIDSIISKVLSLSRNSSNELFRTGKIYVNGRLTENNSQIIKPSDIITVRGFGKFVYEGKCSLSKKGKINALVHIYGLKKK